MKWRHRLIVRLSGLILLTALLPLLGFGIAAIEQSQKALFQQVESANSAIAGRAAEMAEESIADVQRYIALVVKAVDFSGADPVDQEWALEALQMEAPTIVSLTLLDIEGNERVKVSRDKIFLPEDLGNEAGSRAFLEALNNRAHVGSVTNTKQGGRLTLSMPLLNPMGDKVTGVLIAEVSVRNLLKEITSMKVGERGYVFVVDETGKLIAHPDYSKVLAGQNYAEHPHFRHLLEQKAESLKMHSYTPKDGRELLVAGARSNTLGWLIFAEEPAADALAASYFLTHMLEWLFGGVLLLVVGSSVYLLIRVSRPLKRLEWAARQIGEEKFDHHLPVTSKDEIGHVTQAFNSMTENLLAASLERQRRTWLKAGQAELDNEMRGEQDLETLCRKVITFVSKYLKVQVAAFYVMDKEASLKLTGSYAFQRRRHLFTEFKLGEGLVGQAALEKQPIVLTHVPQGYMSIASSLGETSPLNILVFPLLVDDQVMGVLELGSLRELSEKELIFLEEASRAIATAVHTAVVRVKLGEALELSHRQAGRVQQQETSRQADEKIEEQPH